MLPDQQELLERIVGICDKISVYDKKLSKTRSSHPEIDIDFWQKRFELIQKQILVIDEPSQIKELKAKIKQYNEQLKLQGVSGLGNDSIKHYLYQQELKQELKSLKEVCDQQDTSPLIVLPLLERYL